MSPVTEKRSQERDCERGRGREQKIDPEIVTLLQKLERMSPIELDRSAERFAASEKRTAAGLIAHLCEILKRGSHFDLGYGSLFEYATKRLGLDEGAAGLRIHVARAARRRPELLGALAEGRVSLSVAGLLVPHLTSENVERLLSDCAGETKREAQEYVVGIAAPAERPAMASEALSTEKSRHVPAALWDRLLHRAEYRCEYRGLDGRRCTERTGLEPDHFPVPFSRSRSHEEGGIRVHCAAHNRRTAELLLGRSFLERKVAEERAARSITRALATSVLTASP